MPKTTVAYVSTNSICQGEQVGVLWKILFNSYRIKIHFAYQTFKWSNEAKGNAAVHVIIVGFSNYDITKKVLFQNEFVNTEIQVKNINPYLVEGTDVFLLPRKSPICSVEPVNYGSFALDDGNYTISEEERLDLLKSNPVAEKLIRPFLGGQELLHNQKRYCLWLLGATPAEIKQIPKVMERVELVRAWRSKSGRANTVKLASTPTIFAEIRQPKNNYLAFPTLSSVNRTYIPITFMDSNTIASNQLYIIPSASLYSFGILTSNIHMTWVKYICGRFKSDYRYSASIVYNNYPWPEAQSDKQKQAVEDAAQAVLDARSQFPESSLAELYDPNIMPPLIVKAHQVLDKAVDQCYRSQPFTSEAKRIEFLFELYEKYTAGMFVVEKKNKKK
jgi:hypothetical protein